MYTCVVSSGVLRGFGLRRARVFARGVARPLRARRVSVISISVTAVDPLFATLSVDVVVRTYLLSQVL